MRVGFIGVVVRSFVLFSCSFVFAPPSSAWAFTHEIVVSPLHSPRYEHIAVQRRAPAAAAVLNPWPTCLHFLTTPSSSSLWWILSTHFLCEYEREHPFTCQAPDPAVPESFTEPPQYDRTVSCPSSFSTHFSSHAPWGSVRSFAVLNFNCAIKAHNEVVCVGFGRAFFVVYTERACLPPPCFDHWVVVLWRPRLVFTHLHPVLFCPPPPPAARTMRMSLPLSVFLVAVTSGVDVPLAAMCDRDACCHWIASQPPSGPQPRWGTIF